jgi:hypothetical protein
MIDRLKKTRLENLGYTAQMSAAKWRSRGDARRRRDEAREEALTDLAAALSANQVLRQARSNPLRATFKAPDASKRSRSPFRNSAVNKSMSPPRKEDTAMNPLPVSSDFQQDKPDRMRRSKSVGAALALREAATNALNATKGMRVEPKTVRESKTARDSKTVRIEPSQPKLFEAVELPVRTRNRSVRRRTTLPIAPIVAV